MIRKAVKADIENILEVVKDAKELFKSKGSNQWQDLDGYPNFQTFDNDINNDSLYVNEIDGKIVGVCALTKEVEAAYNKVENGSWLNNDKYYVIHRIAVKKEYYGQGVAKDLLTYMEKMAIDDNVFNIKADTKADNISMNELLKKQGYINCGIIYLLRPDVIDKERIAYQKILKKN